MKKRIYILSTIFNSIIALVFFFATIPCMAQTDSRESFEVLYEVRVNDTLTLRIREISLNEYVGLKTESEHLPNNSYKVISDIAKAQEILGERLQLFEREVEGLDDNCFECEIMFNDGTKKRVDLDYGFVAYFPQLEILLFEGANSSDHVFDLNDSNTGITDFDFPHRIRIGNPYYHSVSPDKQLRINGLFDGANDRMIYFLEKWNEANKKYEYIGLLVGGEKDSMKFRDANSWFWVSNDKALFKTGWEDDDSHYYEIVLQLDPITHPF